MSDSWSNQIKKQVLSFPWSLNTTVMSYQQKSFGIRASYQQGKPCHWNERKKSIKAPGTCLHFNIPFNSA